MKGLTPKQDKILYFLTEFTRKHGYPPTMREIGGHFGFLWSAARGHLLALEKKGFIRISPLKSRGIELAGSGNTEGFAVPVAGQIRAGRPMLALEDTEASLFIDKALFPAQDAFALKVKGDSMIEAGILEGDYVIVKPQTTVENGEIGVALIGDEATVKRIFKGRKEIILKPENRTLKPAAYSPGEVAIIGKVTGVIRKIK